MSPVDQERLTDQELCRLLDRLFPNGIGGEDVLAELAPDGWERSPLVACFHPSVERVFEESVRIHRSVARLGRLQRRTGGSTVSRGAMAPEPTIEETRHTFALTPIKPHEEVTELVGMCLWDVFSDNHDVITPDGRIAHMGSFRGASAFLDEYLSGDREGFREGDYLRFYMGTFAVAGRADLTGVYALIFSRLRTAGARWVYYAPEQHRAREAARDAPAPAIIRAFRAAYGDDPPGWPPA